MFTLHMLHTALGKTASLRTKPREKKEKREVLKAHGAKRDQKIVKLLQKRGH